VKWAGKRVLLTGAAGGLGPVTGQAVLDRGATLAISARSQAELEEGFALLSPTDRVVRLAPGSLTDSGFRADLVAEAVNRLGGVDILINNAGIEAIGHLDRTDPVVIDESVLVNLAAVMDLTRLVLPGMLARGTGHVVNMASLAGVGTPPYLSVYAGTKAGVIGFTRSIRAEFRDRGVSASAICPGFVRGGGMYQRKQDRMPVKEPWLLGTTTRQRVAATVIRAVERDLPEPIVNGGPTRIVASLVNAWPGLAGVISHLAGSTALLRAWSDAVAVETEQTD
jgi:short-subunit dehydrogenase